MFQREVRQTLVWAALGLLFVSVIVLFTIRDSRSRSAES